LLLADGDRKGWAYVGNVSPVSLPESNRKDFLNGRLIAGSLRSIAVNYAERNGITSAAQDLQWLHDQVDPLTDLDLFGFMQRQGRGEFGK
jgi:hypothetical protein